MQFYHLSRRYLATTSADQTAKLWKTSDFSLHSTLQTENQRWVWDIAFSADSQYAITGLTLQFIVVSSYLMTDCFVELLTASSDNTARLWSIETSEIAKEYIGHSKALTSLAFQDGTP
jgi:G protein beta subunit-like protein